MHSHIHVHVLCTPHTYSTRLRFFYLRARAERRNEPSDLSKDHARDVTAVEINARSLQQVEAPFQPIGDSPIRPSPQVADDVPVDK